MSRAGELLGGEVLVWGHQANAHPPVLRSHDRFGDRIIASRLAGDHGLAFGTLTPRRDLKAIIERARPAI